MKTDELLREGYRLFHSENNPESNLLVLIFFWNEPHEEDNARTAELIEDDFRKILRMSPEKSYTAIVDLIQFGDSATEVLTPLTKEIYARILNQPQLKRVAVLGSSSHIESLALGVLHMLSLVRVGDDKIKWFTDVQKAKRWLSEVS